MKKTVMFMALLLLLTGVASIVTLGVSDNGSSGESVWHADTDDTAYDGYIRISSVEQLSWIGMGGTHDDGVNGGKVWSPDAKYVQTADMDLTGHDFTIDGFTISVNVAVDVSGNVTFTVRDDSKVSGTMAATKGQVHIWFGQYYGKVTLTDGKVTVTETQYGPSSSITLTMGATIEGKDMAVSKHFENGVEEGTYTFDSDGNFKPISTFKGTYDGNNYAIKGMDTAVCSSNDVAYSGMFGEIGDGAVLKNIRMEGGRSVAVSTATSGENSRAYSGGIVGYASASDSGTLKIENCYNNSPVSSMASNIAYSGGIVGYASASGTLTIENCQNTGAVVSSTSSRAHSGGIIGYASASGTIMIENCFNSGAVVSSTASYSEYTGGIVGCSYTSGLGNLTIQNCKNTGELSSTVSGTSYSGGIVGYARVSNSGTLTIRDCYNKGVAFSSTASGTSYSGGIVSDARVSDSGTLTIENCYNVGAVKATSRASVAYSGGIVGYVFAYNSGVSVTIGNCQNAGEVSSTASSYSAYSGGIVGYASASGTLMIENCYNVGAVKATSTAFVAYSGGIVGYMGGEGKICIFSCYFLKDDVNPTLDLIGSSGSGVTVDGTSQSPPMDPDTVSGGKSALSMKTRSTYYQGTITYDTDNRTVSGWDFVNVWAIDSSVNDGYPYLRALLGITEHPDDMIASVSSDVIFSVTASPIYDPTAYQWQVGDSEDGVWTDIPSATVSSYSFVATDDYMDKYYRCAVTWGSGEDAVTIYSNAAKLFKSSYEVNVSVVEGEGNTSPNGSETVDTGDSISITFIPDTGYELSEVKVNNVNMIGKVSSDSLTISNVTADINVEVTFVRMTYTITVSGEGGRVKTADTTAVHGMEKIIKLSVAEGYVLPDTIAVTVGGIILESGTGYVYDKEAGTVTVDGEYVTENIVITADAVKVPADPGNDKTVIIIAAAVAAVLVIVALAYFMWFRKP